jgi:hypothetical protein
MAGALAAVEGLVEPDPAVPSDATAVVEVVGAVEVVGLVEAWAPLLQPVAVRASTARPAAAPMVVRRMTAPKGYRRLWCSVT